MLNAAFFERDDSKPRPGDAGHPPRTDVLEDTGIRDLGDLWTDLGGEG